MKITTVGIDLAKYSFQAHGVDGRGKAELNKQLKRDQVVRFFANFATVPDRARGRPESSFDVHRVRFRHSRLATLAPIAIDFYRLTDGRSLRGRATAPLAKTILSPVASPMSSQIVAVTGAALDSRSPPSAPSGMTELT